MLGMKHQQMEILRARIAQIEKRPLLADATAIRQLGMRPLSAPGGVLHEVFADERRNAGAALGFSLAQARGLLTPERPVILCMQLLREAQDMGLPYGAGLQSFGIDPRTVVLARAENIVELLWAIEEAVACRAVAAVVTDLGSHHTALDFTASRRLSLRAASAGASIFITRYGSQREASAAKLRWRVSPAISAMVAHDPRAPGRPRWRVELEKGRLDSAAPGPGVADLLLDWTENGFLVVDSSGTGRAAGSASLSGAVPAALGNGLSQAS